MLVDKVVLKVQGGKGGDGAITFRREKYVPRGGPDGGRGGEGGSVFLRASPDKETLRDLTFTFLYQASRGEGGKGKKQEGKKGKDLVVEVPPGTQVFDNQTGELIADLLHPGMAVMVARGGEGGKGNVSFASPDNRTPRMAQKGKEGESRELRLELKLLVDVGLVGLPNAGKSTFLARVSNAKPPMAPYPFSSKEPLLGMVGEDKGKFVLLDTPAIVEGASEGKGLGNKFLRHVERAHLLLYLIDLSSPFSGTSPEEDLRIIREELRKYNALLEDKPFLVIANKLDLLQAQKNWGRFKAVLEKEETEGWGVSAHSGEGVSELLRRVREILKEEREKGGKIVAEEEKREKDTSPAVYRFSSIYLEKLVQEADLHPGEEEEFLNQELEKSGFRRYLLPLKSSSIIEVGERKLVWRGKRLYFEVDE